MIEGWSLRITPTVAKARPGFPADPAVTLKLTVGDFVGFSLGVVSPVTLLTEQRLKLDGDLTVAARLAPTDGDNWATVGLWAFGSVVIVHRARQTWHYVTAGSALLPCGRFGIPVAVRRDLHLPCG